jgi:3-oxoacyl-[acyl-carrier-protein] synthase II
MTRFDSAPFRSRIAAEVTGFDPLDHTDARRARRLDRCALFALAASRMALEDASLCPDALERERVGVIIGSALGGVSFAEVQHRAFLAGGPRSVNPALALLVFAGAAACSVAMELGITGPVSGNGNSCAAGSSAIGEAFRTIRAGLAEVMLAGGTEAPLEPLTFGAFDLIHALSTANETPQLACRPFDRRRDGFVMGEGAAVLVLEECTHALRRGAPIYAEVAGYGLSNDAYHMSAPRPDGLGAARAMQLALAEAGMRPEDVDYLNAHASSTPRNDVAETLAIKQVFGAHAYRMPVSGTKALYGHPLGASGAIEAAICALALRAQWIPPTINLQEPDPACDLDYVPEQGRHAQLRVVLSNSFGFGGINTALVFNAVQERR